MRARSSDAAIQVLENHKSFNTKVNIFGIRPSGRPVRLCLWQFDTLQVHKLNTLHRFLTVLWSPAPSNWEETMKATNKTEDKKLLKLLNDRDINEKIPVIY